MGRVWEWKVERGMGRGGVPTKNLNGKGIQEMVSFTVKDAFLNHP